MEVSQLLNFYIVELRSTLLMMNSFAAIDFETANKEHTSVCSVGVVIVRDGEITDNFYSLIRPEPDYYHYMNVMVHGITYDETVNAPIFPQAWSQIEPLIEGLPLVAHNKGFDESCLKACFRMYRMDYPDYEFYCTLQKARVELKGLPDYKLNTVSAHCGFNLENHHHALADAEACARIAIQIFK